MVASVASSSVGSNYAYESPSRSVASATKSKDAGSRPETSASSPATQPETLTPEQQRQVQQLKEIDRIVRAHEQAHIAVGADLVRGGASFTYQTGPDDKRYAVGGEVSIDVSPGRTPEETIPKAQHVRAAALAPADPSTQDQSVAAKASLMEANARIELSAQRQEEAAENSSAGPLSAVQNGTRFYQAVEQSGTSSASVGGGSIPLPDQSVLSD